MLRRLRVFVVAAALAAGAATFVAAPAGAIVSGPCTAQATADGNAIDLTSATVWHMSRNAIVQGSGHSEPELTSVSVAVSILGLGIPVFSSSGKGHGGDAGPFHAQDYSGIVRVIGASGVAGPCSGSVMIIFDDQTPLGTMAGRAGLGLLLVGILGMLLSAWRGRGGGAIAGGLIFGILAGVGAGLVAEEAGLLDPFNKLDLLVVGGGALLGLVLGIAGGRRRPKATPTA